MRKQFWQPSKFAKNRHDAIVAMPWISMGCYCQTHFDQIGADTQPGGKAGRQAARPPVHPTARRLLAWRLLAKSLL